jgi:hypothetical protein
MKKLLFTLSFLLTVGLFAQQAQAQTRTGFGIRGALNFANLNDTDADFDSRTGLMLGLYANYHISNSPIFIQPEVLYTQKGFESGNTTVQLDYIEIPVLAKFAFITEGNLTPYVYAGPSIGFNINSEVDGDVEIEDLEIIEEFGSDVDIEDQFNSTEFSVVVGGGLDFGNFDLGARYGAGLTEIFDGGGSAKNGVFSITVGIGI